MSDDELKNCALLVYANKLDTGLMTVSEITEKLGLITVRDREWFVQGACALTGDGLYEGLEWLSKHCKV